MKLSVRQFNTWGALIASVSLVVIAFAFTRNSYRSAGSAIHRLNTIGVALSESSRHAYDAMRNPQEVKALLQRKQDLEVRIVECAKPSLVVAEMSENTRAVGASVLEIKPIDVPRAAMLSPSGVPIYPRYQVSIVGSYRDVAEFMRHCPRQRLPVRVVEFVMTRTEVRDAKGEPLLRADITVESYQSIRSDSEGAAKA